MCLYTHRPRSSSFCGSYLESYKVVPKKELLRGLWVVYTWAEKYAYEEPLKGLIICFFGAHGAFGAVFVG